MKTIFASLVIILLFFNNTSAQSYSEQGLELTDSLKKTEYPYIFPIWGADAYKLGYKLPYSLGLGVNYLWQKSDLTLENLMIGFNNGPMTDLDEIVRFNDATSEASGVNFRPDLWLFPFLNVYAIIAHLKTSTSVNAGVYLPDTSNNWQEISAFSTKANFNANTLGFGVTPTFAVKGFWIALDMNFAWTDVDALDKPVFTFVFGPRIGKTFPLNDKEMNIAIWAGAFRVKFTSSTNGSLNLSELFDTQELGSKVDQGLIRVDEAEQNLETWWNGLSEREQQSPVNQAKYETATRTIEAAGKFLNSVDGAINTIGTSTVQYSLDKRVTDMWNFIIGTQYQLNKHWQVRAEYGFLGSRYQFIGGLQYRLGL